MGRWRAMVCLVPLVCACGSTGPGSGLASSERTDQASTPSRPAGPPYAVLVDEGSQPTTYTISVVASDGRVVASATPAARSARSEWLDLPYVSTTSTSLYYLDGQWAVRAIRINGMKTEANPVTNLDLSPGHQEAAFAVSPDDQEIAVSVLDFGRSPVHVVLYTNNLRGDAKHVIFESDSDYVWPVAWRGGLLVLAHAYAPDLQDALKAAPARDNPYWAISYHVVDPTTAIRSVLMGSCTVSGPLSPAGSACIQGGSIDWQGNVSNAWSTHDWGSISAAASISPDGGMIAAADPDRPEQLDIWRPDGSIATSVDGPPPQEWVGWLDNTHIFIPATSKHPPRMLELKPGPSTAAFIEAAGYYASRLPTDIS